MRIYRSIKPMICDDGRDVLALMGFHRRYCTRRRSPRWSLRRDGHLRVPLSPTVMGKVNAGPRSPRQRGPNGGPRTDMRPLSRARCVPDWTTSQARICTENQLRTGCLRSTSKTSFAHDLPCHVCVFSSRSLRTACV